MGNTMQEQPPPNGDKSSRKWLLIGVLAIVAVGIFLFLPRGNTPKRQSTPLALPQQPAIEVSPPGQSQAQLSSPSSVVRPAAPSPVAGGGALLHETGSMPSTAGVAAAPPGGQQSAAITSPASGGVSQPSSPSALQGAVQRPASGTAAQTRAAPAGGAKAAQSTATRKPPRRIATASLAAAPSGTKPRREDWLLKQNPHSYAVQLMGASHEPGILSFIKAHKLGGRAAYFRTRYQGHAWYVLLYGIYPSRSAAQAALKRLPPALRKTSPWVRSLASVRTAIEQARK